MEKLALVLVMVFVAGCSTCNLRYPFDGKAAGWCQRVERADELCEDHGGVKKPYGYGTNECNDGTRVCTDNCEVHK